MNNQKPINFQILDIHTENFTELNDISSNDSDEPKNKEDESKYRIIIFGKDDKERTYTLVVNDFTPYFYIRVPDNFTKDKLKILENWIKEPGPRKDNSYEDKGGGLWNKYHNCLLRLTLHHKMKFRGFNNKKKFKYVRLVFSNTDAMRNCINIFQKKIWDSKENKIKKVMPRNVPPIPGITDYYYKFELHENMIDPMLRFIHHRDIKPVGWITIPPNKYQHLHKFTTSDINIETRWTNVKFDENEKNVKIKILAYDIECDSSHGDFPLAIKDYLKMAREIVIEYDKYYKLGKLKDKTTKLDLIRRMLHCGFVKKPNDLNISQVYCKSQKNFNIEILDTIANSVLKCMAEYNSSVKTLEKNKILNKSIEKLNKLLNINLPQLEGDKTIQIGVSFINYGESKSYRNVMYTLGSCDQIKNTEVKTFDDEKQLLLAFKNLIIKEDPDIITGYNIDNFDTPWLFNRASELGIEEEFSELSKINDLQCQLKERQEKSGVGELVTVKYVNIPGRIQLDIYKLVQKGYNLNSYKLDNVSAEFIQGNIKDIKTSSNQTLIKTDNLRGLNVGNYIIFIEKDGYLDNKYLDGKKFEIRSIEDDTFTIDGMIDLDIMNKKYIWCLGKDDVSPQDIFNLQKGTSKDRYIIAKYCIMDVILCIELLLKLELITNSIGMANVCLIPLNWSIHRGQGVKILSLVSNILRKEDYLIPYLYKDSFTNESFEGAVVLPPYPGIYTDDPVAVLDYASLYPSSMIMGNLSHETICEDEYWLGQEGAKRLTKLGYSFYDVSYDTFDIIKTPAGSIKEKVKNGFKTVRFVKDGEKKGLIPRTLEHLLKARKSTRKKIKYNTVKLSSGKTYSGIVEKLENTTKITDKKTVEVSNDDIIEIKETYTKFEQNVLDGLQLAFKITANSLYGQIGARVGALFYREIAASTTSIGRQQLEIAQNYCEDEKNFEKILENGKKIYLKNKTVYGDTDSVFVRFDCRDNQGNKLKGKSALKETIKLAVQSEKGIKKLLLKPQDLEYEKTFWPFILFTKKRYVGNKYEFDVDKYKQTSMGIVTKRRDNAPIVKVIFGGIIDSIMKTTKIGPSIQFLQQTVSDLINSKYSLDALIISKTLSSYYKDPDRIAHKVLADRMGERDPGNKPQINDRIPYVYIQIDEKKIKGTVLQGDKIENPEYIIKNNLKPNYEFYITNQIMKPVCQIYGLCLEDIPDYKSNIDYDKMMKRFLNEGKDRLESTKKVLEKKQKEAGEILFGEILRKLANERTKSIEITKWFTRKVEKGSKKKKFIIKPKKNSTDSDYESTDDELNI